MSSFLTNEITGARFRRWPASSAWQRKKAAVAVAHILLSIAWAVMRCDVDYVDAGVGYHERLSGIVEHDVSAAALLCSVLVVAKVPT